MLIPFIPFQINTVYKLDKMGGGGMGTPTMLVGVKGVTVPRRGTHTSGNGMSTHRGLVPHA